MEGKSNFLTGASRAATSNGWAVQVYRHTIDRGWEKAEMPQQQTPRSTTIYASPCKGGVEIRQFRVRIRIFKDTNMSSTAARCTKRRNLLFLSTRNLTGSIILKFSSVEECNDFFDLLLDLNSCKNDTQETGENSENVRNMEIDLESTQRLKQDINSYIVQLLHNPDFQGFVKKIEQNISSTEDGAKMLAAFQCNDGEP
jgi:hypothetical protein